MSIPFAGEIWRNPDFYFAFLPVLNGSPPFGRTVFFFSSICHKIVSAAVIMGETRFQHHTGKEGHHGRTAAPGRLFRRGRGRPLRRHRPLWTVPAALLPPHSLRLSRGSGRGAGYLFQSLALPGAAQGRPAPALAVPTGLYRLYRPDTPAEAAALPAPSPALIRPGLHRRGPAPRPAYPQAGGAGPGLWPGHGGTAL